MPAGFPVDVRATDWDDPVATALREAMEAEMRGRYRDRLAELERQAAEPGRRGTITVEPDDVVYVAVAYAAGEPAGHAALRRPPGPPTGDLAGDLAGDLELKRMYVASDQRGTGVSTALLSAVEGAARSLGAPRIVLQTGDRQPDAVRLYERAGYTRIPIFPPYELLRFSICMEKVL
ncbi:GNAT family N-acetyltransferase [Actinomadura macra]|uniref:GNAT family N-acetyltransferase n=1 Tax=Actinomadura macra TaxID=46164 RepID=UPI0008315D09|nr:GNAT family N-acetyltransferase [Actinomadura macra]